MANNQHINIPAHQNLYNGNSNRDLRLEISFPETGVNENTGIAILVPGFGGNIDSKVYKKMREVFSDKNNLVTVQCAYFGSEFMQSASSFYLKGDVNEFLPLLSLEERSALNADSSCLLEILSTKQLSLLLVAKLEETSDNFNDMGFMQAIDIITAIEAVKIILKENNMVFNENRVIGYGHSHGAYLLHLSNRLAPHLFSHIIDNSSWIEPVYLTMNRYLFQSYGKMALQMEFDYIAKKLIEDIKALNFVTLYNNFNNGAKIISFQGTNDDLVDHSLKAKIFHGIEHAELVLVDENRVDHAIFKSNVHGLNADFLKMFKYGLNQLGDHENLNAYLNNYEIRLSCTKIEVDYALGLPVFTRSFK